MVGPLRNGTGLRPIVLQSTPEKFSQDKDVQYRHFLETIASLNMVTERNTLLVTILQTLRQSTNLAQLRHRHDPLTGASYDLAALSIPTQARTCRKFPWACG